MKSFRSIKYWIFDLDNTLYSGKTKVFEQVDKKMSKYISSKLNISVEEAKKIQKNYFHKYNTTLNGMIKNHKTDPNEFLEFVHDINIDFLQKDIELAKEMEKLEGKKIIFTNGSRKHALNVTKRIGIDHLFDDIFDIVDSEFFPKPAMEPYKKLIAEIKSEAAEKLIYDETISEGMIPKIRTCIDAVNNGVRGVVIIDGRKPHSILFELFSDKGSGTLIRK